jgi:NitT/TauT family transport system ATP-binding protein
MATLPLLSAQGISFSHPGQTPLIENLDLSIEQNEVVVLLGTSGCGKSTLLRLLAGLTKLQAGTISFEGAHLAGPHPRTSLLFQQPSLLPWLRVDKNIEFGLDFQHQPEITKDELQIRSKDALASVSLDTHSKSWPSQLSGGMAQRVALARALARKPILLFADEPFSALDAITRSEMQQLLLKVVDQFKMAVLLVTHDIDEALTIADRIVLMDAGVLAAQWVLPAEQSERSSLRTAIHEALLRSHARKKQGTGIEQLQYAI